MQVEWRDSVAGFYPFTDWDEIRFKIVGNIYENPELLNGATNGD
jgi:hypothetical protein